MKKILGVALAFVSSQTFAFFCPTNFSQINTGDTLEQVIAVCGAPDSTKTTTEEANTPQELTYYVNPTGSNTGQPLPQVTSLKMTVAISAEGKVNNITVNGQSLITTPICNGNSIQVGDTFKTVKAACGDPGFVNKGQVANGAAKETKTTELRYNSNPPATLIFVDGKLQARK